ncbi:MAG: HD domain-containing protein [Planctomycetota bacterium]|mgnify:CR=1 FL=1|nr:MAG: HD domain-containing protein [Planctomycetota bacterium]
MALGERFDEALVYASRLHADQTRKGSGAPYISHLLGVASIVIEHGGSEDEAIGALLHDAVEDQGGQPTLEAIRKRFGPAVAEIVDGCSDSDTTPKPPWRERKEQYLAHLPGASRSVQLVSAADKLYNCRSIVDDYLRVGDDVWQRFKGGRDGTLWYYRAIVEAFSELDGTALLEQLDRSVTELESLAGTRSA